MLLPQLMFVSKPLKSQAAPAQEYADLAKLHAAPVMLQEAQSHDQSALKHSPAPHGKFPSPLVEPPSSVVKPQTPLMESQALEQEKQTRLRTRPATMGHNQATLKERPVLLCDSQTMPLDYQVPVLERQNTSLERKTTSLERQAPLVLLGATHILKQNLAPLLEQEEAILAHCCKLPPARALTYSTGRALLKYALVSHPDALLAPDALLPPLHYNEHGKPSFAITSSYHDSVAAITTSLASSPEGSLATLSLLSTTTPAVTTANTVANTVATLAHPNFVSTATIATAPAAASITAPAALSSWHFNLTHGGALLGLALGKSVQGLDVEPICPQRLRERLVKQVLSLEEISYWQSLSSSSSKAFFFFKQWTIREALIKALGLTIFVARQLNFALERKTIIHPSLPPGQICCYYLAKSMLERLGVHEAALVTTPVVDEAATNTTAPAVSTSSAAVDVTATSTNAAAATTSTATTCTASTSSYPEAESATSKSAQGYWLAVFVGLPEIYYGATLNSTTTVESSPMLANSTAFTNSQALVNTSPYLTLLGLDPQEHAFVPLSLKPVEVWTLHSK